MERDHLDKLSRQLRKEVLTLHKRCGSGHIGCSLSCLELLIASLILSKRPQEAFILSKGHAALALYVCLEYLGEISPEQMQTVNDPEGTHLPAHPAAGQFASIPFALGSLGHGLPIAAGICQANSILKNDQATFVLMSDGETNAGTTWEAAHFAVRHRLDRLMVIIDRNGLQGFGKTEDVLGDSADPRKWEATGFEVAECGGHDLPLILSCLERFRSASNGKPKVLIANTVKGRGVSYMENRLEWHYLPMSEAQYRAALQEVDAQSVF